VRRLTVPEYETRIAGESDYLLINVRPAPVPLEDDLAAFTAEHDLEVPSPDRPGIPAAYRA
jgi:hypothetical protein